MSDAMQAPQPGWGETSAFDVLDESWPDEARGGQSKDNKEAGVLGDRTNVAVTREDEDRRAKVSAAFDAAVASVDLETIAGPSNGTLYAKDDLASVKTRRRRSSSAATDSELLQAGPSSPSRRLPSHKLSRTFGGTATSQSSFALERDDENRAIDVPVDVSAGVSKDFARASSSSSSHSEQKRTASPFAEEGIGDGHGVREETGVGGITNNEGDHYGSAVEEVSYSQAALTAEEGTFIEYSNVASPPPFMKQAWQKKDKRKPHKDMFGPSPLQALFVPPSPELRPISNGEDDDLEKGLQPQEDESDSRFDDDKAGDAQEAPDVDAEEEDTSMLIDEGTAEIEASVTDVEDASLDSPRSSEEGSEEEDDDGHDGSDAGSGGEQTVDETAASKDEMVDASIMQSSGFTEASSGEVGEDSMGAEEQDRSRDPQALQEGTDSPIEQATASILMQEASPQKSADVPVTTFTFATPLVTRSKRPPPTPSSVHAPLRLLQLKGRDPEVEHILNTPRSAARSREVKKLVWKLVGQGIQEQRGRKRARIDDNDAPEEQLGERDVIQELSTEAEEEADVSGPRFLDRVRQLRAASEGSNRTASSLIEQRKGAKAPTPETARLAAGVVAAAITEEEQADKESPSKLLRRWSAANMAGEMSSKQTRARGAIPSLSVNSPEASSPTKYLFAEARGDYFSRPAEHPGMLQISAGAVPLQEMEALSDGKMTFDAEGKRWVRVQQLRHELDSSNPSLDDSVDPFRDIESIVSTAAIKPSGQEGAADQSIPALPQFRIDQGAAALAPPAVWLSRAEPELLTPAKKADAEANRSTPRSILKTAGSMGRRGRWPTSDATPTLERHASRKISFADGINPRSVVSLRKEKMAHLLNQLGSLALGLDEEDDVQGAINGPPHADDRQGTKWLSPEHPSFRRTPSTPESLMQSQLVSKAQIRAGERSPWGLSQLRRTNGREADMSNASFMTNASFNIAHDRILELLTDIAPWTTRWHEMRKIDLRGRRVESLVRIEEFLPQLEEALLDDNEITYLTGLPSTLRRLFIARNRLPSTAAFGHLANLELLDVSGNHVDLKALRPLSRLRHLRANGNRITGLEGLQDLRALETLHLRDNLIESVEVEKGQWPRMQDLVLSRNRIASVEGLHNMPQLQCLNLDHNRLAALHFDDALPQLKQLRVSGNNDLQTLDVAPAMNLRTLYADECGLHEVKNVGMLHKLDNLSLRQQHGQRSLHWPAQEIRDVKRLFLSGNAFRAIELSNARRTSRVSPFATLAPLSGNGGMTQFFGLIYLELSGCQLTALPADLAEMTPNLRHLNADYNLLDSLPVLTNLRRLKRLSVVGCRIDNSPTLVESIVGCEELVYLDVRMNPCTLGLYPPIVMATANRGKRDINRAFLPPIPHPLFAGVPMPKGDGDGTATKPQDESLMDDDGDGPLRGMGSVAEKSFFHKRRPPPMLADSFGSRADGGGKEERGEERGSSASDQDLGVLFAAADQRFARTLPAKFRTQRILHRGCLAMACASLIWLDGLLIDEEEVVEAERHLQSKASRGHARPSAGAHVEEMDGGDATTSASDDDDLSSSTDGR